MVPYTHLADAKKESQAHTRDETTDLCASLPPSSKHGNLNNPFRRVGEGYTTSCRVVCVYWMLRGSFLSLSADGTLPTGRQCIPRIYWPILLMFILPRTTMDSRGQYLRDF